MNKFSKHNIIAALECMAIGDAFGDKFEFDDRDEFSPDDILAQTNIEYTDDTQMTLFGFESIIDNIPIQESYINWYKTQTQDFQKGNGLMSFPEMFSVKSPGNTCMSALQSLDNYHKQTNTYKEAKNSSYGCGSVMRILPFALVGFDWNMVRESIVTTHGHYLNLAAASNLISAYQGILARNSLLKAKDITQIGEGWVATECVDMAIWAVNNSKNFDELLVNSIHHGGDSDSVAAIACSIWGLLGRQYDYYDRVDNKAPIEYIKTKILNY